jgi:NitT/TauT family transport system permease protein
MSSKDPSSGPKTQNLRPTVFWRMVEDIPRPLQNGLTVASVAIPFLGWWLFTSIGHIDPLFLPSPAKVLVAFGKLWSSGELVQDTIASLRRVSTGFLLSVLCAMPVGVLMGSFPSIRALLEPLFGLMRYMPAPAFIPLLILYLGIDEAPKISLIFIGTFFFNTLMIMDAVKFVPKDLLEATFMLGGNRYQALTQVILPHVLPGIIDACRINLAAAWQLVIVSELIAATEGLGRRISLAGRNLKTDEIFVGIIIIGLIGLAFDLLFRLLLNLSCKWANQAK